MKLFVVETVGIGRQRVREQGTQEIASRLLLHIVIDSRLFEINLVLL